jgi:hypothetical protein
VTKPFHPHQDEFWRAEPVNGTAIVLVERSSRPFSSPLDVERSCSALNRSLDTQLDRSRHDLLIDLRSVAGRNDPEFERIIQPERIRLQHGFRRIAVLVNSVVGRLQIQRYATRDGAKLRIFQDRSKAIEWLTA